MVRREALGTTTPLGSDPLYRKHIEFYNMPLSSQIDFLKIMIIYVFKYLIKELLIYGLILQK